jgi:hypothetical protein
LPLDCHHKNLPLADDPHVLPALRIRANLVASMVTVIERSSTPPTGGCCKPQPRCSVAKATSRLARTALAAVCVQAIWTASAPSISSFGAAFIVSAAKGYANSSNSPFASLRSRVSNPSVNHP